MALVYSVGNIDIGPRVNIIASYEDLMKELENSRNISLSGRGRLEQIGEKLIDSFPAIQATRDPREIYEIMRNARADKFIRDNTAKIPESVQGEAREFLEDLIYDQAWGNDSGHIQIGRFLNALDKIKPNNEEEKPTAQEIAELYLKLSQPQFSGLIAGGFVSVNRNPDYKKTHFGPIRATFNWTQIEKDAKGEIQDQDGYGGYKVVSYQGQRFAIHPGSLACYAITENGELGEKFNFRVLE
ncbi:hypothetical protein M1615_01625 [Patescibacteria group bacterium]|nr:hypothetical protein [Patescibacteria group bacterium]